MKTLLTLASRSELGETGLLDQRPVAIIAFYQTSPAL
jgi:hypothetical protein